MCMYACVMYVYVLYAEVDTRQPERHVSAGRTNTFFGRYSEKSDVLLRIRLVSSIFLAHAILTIAASNLQLWVSSWSTSLF